VQNVASAPVLTELAGQSTQEPPLTYCDPSDAHEGAGDGASDNSAMTSPSHK
jgi:hypothetical protein